MFNITATVNHVNTIKDQEEHEFFFKSLSSEEIELLYCGYEKCKPGHKYGPLTRNHFYYHFVVSGKGIYRNNNTEFKVTAGSGFIGFPNQVVYYKADEEDPWTYMWVGIKGALLLSLLDETGLSKDMPIIHQKDPEKIIDILNSLISCAQDSSSTSLIRATGLFCLLLSELSESNSQIPNIGHITSKFNTQDYIDKAIHFIQMNYSKNISMPIIANYVGIDVSYLSRIFKHKYNITPAEFLTNYRINFSNQLLLNTTMPINQVAMSAGFNDPQYFSRCFTKQKGMSPSEVRKGYKNVDHEG